MTAGAGLVIVHITSETREEVEGLCAQAIRSVDPGRSIAVIFAVPNEWREQRPVEGWVVEALNGPPESRKETDQDECLYFANLVVRAYGADPIVPVDTYHVIVVRRQGLPAYKRRLEEGAPIQADLLDSSAPVFTRDLANNTWHLPADRVYEQVIARLARLLCWSDERVTEITHGVVERDVSNLRSEVFEDLIGVPTKVPYRWDVGSTRPRQMNLLGDASDIGMGGST